MNDHPRAPKKSTIQLAVGVFVAVGLGAAAALVPMPYAIISPGPATDVLGSSTGKDGTATPRIIIESAQTYPTTGSLDFTTVSVRGGPGYFGGTSPCHSIPRDSCARSWY